MRTVRTKVYQFAELSDKAKDKARAYMNENFGLTDHVYDEAAETVKKFHEIFGTKEGNSSWLDVRTGHIDDNVLELKGLRLQKYIWNNFGKYLYKGKYYSLWSNTEKSYKHYKEGHPVLKTRYSKITLDNSCVLTGVCYDNDLLDPMYDFLERYKDKADYYSYMDFETLLTDCFKSLEKSIENEIDSIDSDESLKDLCEANNYEFTQEGIFYN